MAQMSPANTPASPTTAALVVAEANIARAAEATKTTPAAASTAAAALIATSVTAERANASSTYARIAAARAAAMGGVAFANESMHTDTGVWTTVPAANSRKRYTAIRDAEVIRVVYTNIGGRDDVSGAGLTVRAAVESGTDITPIYFAGKRDVVIDPGGIATSDPVHADLSTGTQFWVRTHFAGANFPYAGPPHGLSVAAWGEGCDAANTITQPDLSMSGTISGIGSQYCPLTILSTTPTSAAVVGLIGDSIMAGLGDIADGSIAAGRGFGRRALNNALPYVSIAASGEHTYESRRYRQPTLGGTSSILCNLGVNDFVATDTAAATYPRLLTIWTIHARRGAAVWQTTITPVTTSTDVWATTGNQTPFANNADRVAVNNWIRAGAPIDPTTKVYAAIGTVGALLAGQVGHPLAGYFETADTVETARNSGIWKVGYVYLTDAAGIHPNATGHAAMAAAINPALFT